MQTKHLCVLIHIWTKGEVGAALKRLKPSSKIFHLHSKVVLLLWILYGVFSVLCLLCLCTRLFICALWSPAGKGLASWLSFLVSYCEFVTFHWYPGSGVVLDYIHSWSLHPYLLLYKASRGVLFSLNIIFAAFCSKFVLVCNISCAKT